jgi:aspartate racemase
MPVVLPPGGEVAWPAEEGALGVVGVAPWATLEFCKALYTRVNAEKDWHYPRVLLDINAKIPSRGRHLQLGEQDPSPAIAATIRELANQGATVAVVVCNTAHILYERWSAGAPIPVLDILAETVDYAAARGAERVAPLVSASLAERDLYGVRASLRGLDCLRLKGGDQRLVESLIESIKVTGAIASSMQSAVHTLFVTLRSSEVDTIIAGCTELSLLSSIAESVGLRWVDSNVALAEAALRRLRMAGSRLRE